MFEVGDVVRLRSGGPSMTVVEVGVKGDLDDVYCSWFPSRHSDVMTRLFCRTTLYMVERLRHDDAGE